MRSFLFTFWLLLITSALFAQQLEITWQNCYGGSGNDEPWSLCKTDSGFFIVGASISKDGYITNNHGGDDAWLIKTDSSGNMLWNKCFGGSAADGGIEIIPTNNESYFVVGGSYSSNGDISYDPYPGSFDYWIFKINSQGDIIWDKIIGGSWLDQAWSGCGTSDGGVVAVGWTGSQDGDVSNYYGLYDIWVVKLDSIGTLQWDFTLGTNGSENGICIIETSDGGFLVGGHAAPFDGDGNMDCSPLGENPDAFLAKLDSEGNLLWHQCYGGSGHDFFTALLETSDGYLIAGSGGSEDGDLTNSGWHGKLDMWIVKTDYEGNIIWQKCYGGTNDDGARIIFETDDQEYVIIGQSRSHNGDVVGNNSLSEYNHDIWIIKVDQSGDLISQQCIGGINDEHPWGGAVKTSDHNYVISAVVEFSPSFDVQCGYNPSMKDYWIFEAIDCSYYLGFSPFIESGPDTVLLPGNITSDFICTPLSYSFAYEWSLEPPEAGNITGDSVITTVNWNPEYKGQATLRVRGINACGESAWSEPYLIQVYNSLGYDEHKNKFIRVYPIPAHDRVIFETPDKTEGTIIISDVYGNQVDELFLAGEKVIWRTGHIRSGVYIYVLNTVNQKLQGKIVINHL